MPHLSQVKTADSQKEPLVEGLEKLSFEPEFPDDVNASVYGSSWASKDLPMSEMPEKEMPKEVAYRMIKCVSPLMKWFRADIV